MLIGSHLRPSTLRHVGLLTSLQSADRMTLGINQTTRVVDLRSESGSTLGELKL